MQTYASNSTNTPAPLAWIRAIAFGVVSGGIGVLGHDMIAGTPTNIVFLLLGISFATVMMRIVTSLRINRLNLFLSVAAMQTAIHLACIVLMDQNLALNSAFAHQHFTTSEDTHSAFLMFFIHALAVVIGALILFELEQFAWSLIDSAKQKVIKVFLAYLYKHKNISTKKPLYIALITLSLTCKIHKFTKISYPRGPPQTT